MPTATLPAADDIVTSWLTDPTPDDPAGPLYLGGEFAVQEITMTGGGFTFTTFCSFCTGSVTMHCCA